MSMKNNESRPLQGQLMTRKQTKHGVSYIFKGLIISSILLSSVLTSGMPVLTDSNTASASTVNIVKITTLVNNKKVTYKQPSVVYAGKLMLPLPSISDTYGAKVKVNTKAKTSTVTKGNTKIVLTTGSATAIVNGKSYNMPHKVLTIKGTTMVPVEILKKINRNTTTSYSGKTKTLKISTAKKVTRTVVNGITVKYGNHTYASNNQKEYDKVMSIVASSAKGYNTTKFSNGSQSEYFTAFVSGAKWSGDRTDRSTRNIGLKLAENYIGSLVDSGLSSTEVVKAYNIARLSNTLVSDASDTNIASTNSAYDALVRKLTDCDSTAQVTSAVFDYYGYNTAILGGQGHAEAYVKIGDTWFNITGEAFTQIEGSLGTVAKEMDVISAPTTGKY